MPRDANGTYTLPDGLPQPKTSISSAWMNTTLNDIKDALTESASVDGSVTPEMFANDPIGFQVKMGVRDQFLELIARTDALMARNDAEIGSISSHALLSGTPAHNLVCNGSTVSRVTYAALFAKIGTTFGAGDGSTTFGLPDLRSEWLKGWDHGRGVDPGRSLNSPQAARTQTHTHAGSTGNAGTHSHTATTASSGSHDHSASTSTAGAHTHTYSGNTGNNSVGHTHAFSMTTDTEPAHSHTFSAPNILSSASANVIIDAIGSGAGPATSTSGSHTHTASGTSGGASADHTHTFSGTAQSAGDHTHAVTFNDSASHTHTLTTAVAAGHTHTITVSTTGFENRIRSVALLPCIKFE